MILHRYILMATCSLSLTGCGGATIGGRIDTAHDLASAATLQRQDLPAPPFLLASWQRISDPAAPVNVYIEGDGLAWLSRSMPSGNPTPKNPVGLSLAAKDSSANVVYLARPCQYTPIGVTGNVCPDKYWRGQRFAPEVIQSYQTALNAIAGKAPGGFHLIGYSGGANIAGLIAARRNDVLSLRTVAGNIDNDAFIKFHDVSTMPGSLNMADEAESLSVLPQIHFIGGEDDIVPPDIYKSYINKTGSTSCIHSKTLPEVSHIKGWDEQWPTLLTLPVNCAH